MPPQDNQGFPPQPTPQNQPPQLPGQNDPVEYREDNAIAVVGFVFAFLIPLVGLICSILGLKKSKRTGGKFYGLALAGTILSAVFMVIGLLWFVTIILIAVPALQRNARNEQRLADVAALRAQVEVWVSNNTGSMPESRQDIDSIVGEIHWTHYGALHGRPEAMARFTAIPPGVSQDEDVVIMFTAAATDEAVAATALPTPEVLHIWLGRQCGSGYPGSGNHYVSDDNTYRADGLALAPARAVAVVYQLEGKDNAHCEDNV